MWIPRDEAEINSVVANKVLKETATFDAKREISPKNLDIAKDVSAMANTSGGVLIYGISEDESGSPNVLSPILLKGQCEKIEAIVRTSIEEVPVFKVSTIHTQADDSKGYLIVFVPPSERTPHMVIVKGERRFYGRGETGNYVLSQTEVARLYERRRIAETSVLPILDEKINQCPIKEHNGFAHLHVIIKPVLQDDGTLGKALLLEQTYNQLLNTSLANILKSNHFWEPSEPNFYVKGWVRDADGFVCKISDPLTDRYAKFALYLEVNFDGSGSLFCSRAAETITQGDNEIKWFFSDLVAGHTTKFLALFGDIYKRASYFGKVDIGVGLTGLENSYDYNSRNDFFGGNYRYTKPVYKNTRRVSAMELEDNSKQAASDLLTRLIDGVSQGKYNPFEQISS